MDKKEFIEKFSSSKSVQKRNRKAEKTSGGMIKFDYSENMPSIEFCEICIHPKGRTVNAYEMCMSADDIDIRKFKEVVAAHSETIREEYGEHCQLISHLVIPPEPKMIMKLSEHLDELLEMNVVVTVYDPESDKRGSCPMNEEFFQALRDYEDYEGMKDPEIFTNFLMNFIEML